MLAKIVSKDFVTSLYFVVDRLIMMEKNGATAQVKEFVNIGLECCKKVIMSKVTFLDRERKSIFLRTNF